jgi:UDP-N-acetylglucosamine 4,6-dehydratase/5-epimerase
MSASSRPISDGTSSVDFLNGRTLLITGGTGSFGQTMLRTVLADSRVRSVAVYSRDEQKHVQLLRSVSDPRLTTIVGDVRDLDRLRFALRGVDFVFNAAAIKHVHLSEQHPMEAVRTNIMGAANVSQAALEAGVRALVTLSTDKAVEPVNVMGMSKALQERVVASFAGQGMRVGIVRYGNVLASNGSVVPYFLSRIREGADTLPVTDRRMTRFVLTLRESVALVLHALAVAQNGETFVLDLPAFRIWDVAEVMAAAARGSRRVSVQETGIRPGEKLHECLVSSEEMRRAKRDDGVWRIERYESGEQRFAPSLEERELCSDRVRQLTHSEIDDLLRANGLLP